jgi:CRP-like cAMP-binding protein
LIEAHLLKLRKRDTISSAEERAIRSVIKEARRVPARTTLIREGERLEQSLLLIDGWLGRAVDMKEGGRVITEIHVAGDFADLHGFTLKRLDHDVVTLSGSLIATAPHDSLAKLTEQFPHVARVYWFSTNVDAAIHRQWTVSLGQRTAISRAAHLFCELFVRLGVVGKTNGTSCDLPLTQEQLAACLGLTSVHVNRTLQALRRRSLIELHNKRLTILDMPGLQKIAEFDPSYLYLEHEPK